MCAKSFANSSGAWQATELWRLHKYKPLPTGKRWEGRVAGATGSELRRMLGPGPLWRKNCAGGNACVQAYEH